MLRHAPAGGPRRRGMRDPIEVSGGDSLSLPSLAEVAHADWPALKRMCVSLELNPKGRSAIVRMRVFDHVRRRVRAEAWRLGREHEAALSTSGNPRSSSMRPPRGSVSVM